MPSNEGTCARVLGTRPEWDQDLVVTYSDNQKGFKSVEFGLKLKIE